jgi:hypothetical protein
MNLVNMHFREVAALGFVRRFSRALFALVFSVAVAIGADRMPGGLEFWKSPWTAGVLVLLPVILLLLVRESLPGDRPRGPDRSVEERNRDHPEPQGKRGLRQPGPERDMAGGPERVDWKRLGLMLLLVLGFRLFGYTSTYVIHPDGIHFYNLASDFAAGRFLTGLDRSTFHPLYPLLIAAVGRGLRINLETAGYTVSILFSVLTTVPLFVFGTRVFGRKIALLGVFFFAVNPIIIRCSTEVVTEATYTFFFVSGVSLGWLAIREEKIRFYLPAGVAVFFAYMTRPEGMALLLPLIGWALLTGRRPFREVWKRRTVSVLCLLLVFLVMAAPFLIHVHKETGGWNISRKLPVANLVEDVRKIVLGPSAQGKGEETESARSENEGSATRKIPWVLGVLGTEIPMDIYPTFSLLILISFYRSGRVQRSARAETFFLTIFALHFLLFVRVLAVHGYFSARYLIPFTVLLMLWAAAGAWELREMILSRWRRAKERPEHSRRVIMAAVIVIAVVSSVPKTLRPYGANKWGERVAGLWIKEHDPTGPAIATDLPRVPHYAAGTCFPLLPGSYSDVVRSLKDQRIPYLVVADENVDKRIPRFFSQIRPEDLEEIYFCPRSLKDPEGEEVIVYRVKW